MSKRRKNNKVYLSAILTAVIALFAIGYNNLEIDTDNNNQAIVVDGNFEVHYIDVGQADAELVLCDGESMLIDGGNAADSNLIVSYLRDLNIDHLNYIVCTHAHEDHVGGLSGALNECTVDNVLCSTDNHDTKVFKNFKKYTEAQGKEIEIPETGDTFELGESYVEILGPQREYDELNNNSIVMKVTYGETSFLFTGDAEREAEQDIIDAGYDLSADVLKVGHHGSNSSTSYVFLREIMPKYAVISCGKDNSYGHPHEEPLSRLRDAGVTVYRTDESGHIVAVSDGKNISFQTEK
jgi:competence protein ComEC